MPIPTEADRRMGEIETLAMSVSTALRTLRFSQRPDDRQIRVVREHAQRYVDAVMVLAHDLVDSAVE
jgi:hypothetical protein